MRRAVSYLTSVLCVLSILTLTGCFMPVGVPREKRSRQEASAPTVVASPSALVSSETTPVSRLTVNSYAVEAEALWKGHHEGLADQAEALSPQEYRTYVARGAAQLVRDKLTEMLLYQRAAAPLTPEMEERISDYADVEIRKIVSTQFEGRQRRYENKLQAQGHSLEGAREAMRRQIIISNYLEQEVKPKITEPTRNELLAIFEASADSFRKPARRRMSLIDVRVRNRLPDGVDQPNAEQLDQARAVALERINAARVELESGTDFADVVPRYSDGLHAHDGGSWGWVTPGSVRERFEPAVEALYQLDEKAVSDVIDVEDGFLLVRCDEIDPGVEADFEALQPQLADRHFRTAYNKAIMDLVEELRQNARIEPANLERFFAAVVEAAPFMPEAVDR